MGVNRALAGFESEAVVETTGRFRAMGLCDRDSLCPLFIAELHVGGLIHP